jgi:hypothetical protein
MKLSGTYSVSKWDETAYRPDQDGMRYTKTSAKFAFSGDIVGFAYVEYLMLYSFFDETDMHKSVAQYVGHLKIEGDVKGKSGSFVLTDSGTFDGGIASSEVDIITGSGTGDLKGIVGLGTYQTDEKGCKWELDVQF